MLSLLFVFILHFTHTLPYKQITVKRAEMCEPKNNLPCKVYAHFENKDDIQLMTANLSISEPWGENVMVDIKFMVVRGVEWLTIWHQKMNLCKIIKTFMGPFVDDIFKAAQLMPGTCPVPKGKYNIKNYPLDFRNLFVKETFPLGVIKFVGKNYNKVNGKELICYTAEFEVKNE